MLPNGPGVLHSGYHATCGTVELYITRIEDGVLVRIFERSESHSDAVGVEVFNGLDADMEAAMKLARDEAKRLGAHCPRDLPWVAYEKV
jgi:hypothetical protein